MEKKKKLERGLAEVSHLFLSGEEDRKPEEEPAAGYVRGETTPEPDAGRREKRRGRVERKSILFFSADTLGTERFFLCGNLALEFARRNYSVGLVETGSGNSGVYFLPGSLSSRSASPESTDLPGEKIPARRPPEPETRPLEVMDISVDGGKDIKTVLIPWENLESSSSFSLLEKIKEEVDFLLINMAEVSPVKLTVISPDDPFCVLPITADPDELLKSYAVIKKLSHNLPGCNLGITVMKEIDAHKIEGALTVMKMMVKKFLRVRFDFIEIVPRVPEISRSMLNRKPLIPEAESSSACEAIKKIAGVLEKQE